MPTRVNGGVPRSTLVDAPLPQATKTYTVISHEFVITTALRLLSEKGFKVIDEKYSCTANAQIASGIYRINYGDDPDLGMIFAFSNSYNKVLRFRCAIGGFVKVNETSVLGDTSLAWGRKHTGNADTETLETIEAQIDNADVYFKQLKADKEVMKKIKLTPREFAELAGRLYIDLRIMTAEQIRIVRNEFEKPSVNYSTDADSLWTLYNHILMALAKSHPRTWMEQQKIVHLHLMSEYKLTKFDDDTEAPVKDPNQLDLIEEAEKLAELDNPEIPSQEEINAGDFGEDFEEDTVEEPDDETQEETHVTEEELGYKPGEYNVVQAHVETDEEHNARVAKIEGEPEEEPALPLSHLPDNLPTKEEPQAFDWKIQGEQKKEGILPSSGGKGWSRPKPANDLDQEEDDDWDKHMTPIEPEAKEDTKPVVEEKPKPFVSREEGAELRAEAKAKATVTAPKPTMTIAVALEKYGQFLTDDQRNDLKNGVMNEEAIAIFRAKAAEEGITQTKPEPVEAESSLPSSPTQEESKSPEVEEVEESVEETVVEDEVEETVEDEPADGEFFMSKADLDEMYPGVELEIGYVVTVMDNEFEITTADPDSDKYGLTAIALEDVEEEDEVNEEPVAEVEEEVKESAPAPEVVEETVDEVEEDAFEIGDAVTMASTKTMLKPKTEKKEVEKPALDQEAEAKADEAIAIMEAKVEKTPEEKAIEAAIAFEIEDLYGAKVPFTYELSGSQYNVKLETGETVALTVDYINAIKGKA